MSRVTITIQVNVAPLIFYFYPALMGSKIPTSKFSESKEFRWEINCP